MKRQYFQIIIKNILVTTFLVKLIL